MIEPEDVRRALDGARESIAIGTQLQAAVTDTDRETAGRLVTAWLNATVDLVGPEAIETLYVAAVARLLACWLEASGAGGDSVVYRWGMLNAISDEIAAYRWETPIPSVFREAFE